VTQQTSTSITFTEEKVTGSSDLIELSIHMGADNMATETRTELNQYTEPSQIDRISKKAKDAPFVPIGIAGMVGAVAYGAFTFRKRGSMSPSVFLMHLRVKAQGMVVGAITLGIGYTLFKDYIWKKDEHVKELEAEDLKFVEAKKEKDLQMSLAKHNHNNHKDK